MRHGSTVNSKPSITLVSGNQHHHLASVGTACKWCIDIHASNILIDTHKKRQKEIDI